MMNSEMVSISPVREAAAGYVGGSVYEHRRHKSEEFTLLAGASRFTDDTVLTAGVHERLAGELDAFDRTTRGGSAYQLYRTS